MSVNRSFYWQNKVESIKNDIKRLLLTPECPEKYEAISCEVDELVKYEKCLEDFEAGICPAL